MNNPVTSALFWGPFFVCFLLKTKNWPLPMEEGKIRKKTMHSSELNPSHVLWVLSYPWHHSLSSCIKKFPTWQDTKGFILSFSTPSQFQGFCFDLCIYFTFSHMPLWWYLGLIILLFHGLLIVFGSINLMVILKLGYWLLLVLAGLDNCASKDCR